MLDETAMIWSASEAERAGRPLLILLHGRYGTEQDMAPFFPALPDGVVAVSVRGPVPWGDKWAWAPEWDGDQAAIGQVRAVVRDLLSWIDALSGFRSIGLAGFSQGGATALLLLQSAPRRFAYAVQLCGFFAPELSGPDEELIAVRPPVLNLRCGQDKAIPAELADYTSAWLRARTTLTERTFPGLGHHITPELITATAGYLREHVG